MKKKILFVYPDMMIGGSTTSLLSILNLIDYSKYEVDLLLGLNSGPLFHLIPPEVNILAQAHSYNNKYERLFKVITKPKVGLAFFNARRLALKSKNLLISHQIMAYEKIKFDRVHKKEYDIAISFLEGWSTAYVAAHIKAEKKIAWLHLDYIGSGLIPKYDKNVYKNFDTVVLVSQKCKESFDLVFPEYSSNSIVAENILLQSTIKKLSEEPNCNLSLDENFINMVTNCRIVFSHKGLDRAVQVLHEIKQDSVRLRLRWYIIGDGPDFEKLRKLVNQKNLSDSIFLIGEQTNPFKFMKSMDLFLLPSYYEGKPMAVTEALMLGLPALVTEYASSKEQIDNRLDGLIFDNNYNSLYNGLKDINEDKVDLTILKENVGKNNYSNITDFESVQKLLL